MTSYSRSDYISRVGNLTSRMAAVAAADQSRREAQANVAGMQAQLQDAAATLPVDKDDNAMGVSLGAAEGYKYLLKNQVAPRLATAIKSRAAARLQSIVDDARPRSGLADMGFTEDDAAQLFDEAPQQATAGAARLSRASTARATAAEADPFGIVDPSTQRGLADQMAAEIQPRLAALRDAVVNRLQSVRDAVANRVAPAQQEYQSRLSEAAARQNATGQIIKDEHLQALERDYGVNFGELRTSDVDASARALLGDETTQGLADGLTEGASALGSALEYLGPVADAVGLGFGIAGAYAESAAENKAEQEQQRLNQLQGALSAPVLAGGLGTGSTMDSRTDRQGGLANF